VANSVVKTILGAVSGAASGVAQIPRRAPALRHPDASRVIIPGPDRAVEQISQAEATASLTRALNARDQLQIIEYGMERNAAQVVPDDVSFFTDVTDGMYDRALQLTDNVDAEARALVYGKNKVKGSLLSVDERMTRFGKALMTAVLEMRARGLDPNLLKTNVFVQDALMRLCRGYISRANLPGELFEFVWAAGVEPLRVPGQLAFVHQLRAPTLRGDQLASCTDWLIQDTLRGQAFGGQLKAYDNIDRLAAGEIVWRLVDDILRSVSGPAIQTQLISDFRRYQPWGNKVPAEGMPLPTTVFPETAGWLTLRPVMPFVVDDVHLMNRTFSLISEPFRTTGKDVLDIATDINASPRAREQLVSMFPDGIVRGQFTSPADIFDHFDAWLETTIREVEAETNAYLATGPVHGLLGRYCELRLFRASDGPEAAMRGLGVLE